MAYEWDREESVGGWGYRMQLTESQRAEIDTCLDCPLDDCRGIDSPKCPLWLKARREKRGRDIQALISAWWRKTDPMSDYNSYQT